LPNYGFFIIKASTVNRFIKLLTQKNDLTNDRPRKSI
jgi:hypothetical protein